MNSTVKIVLALGALVAIVFVITVITQYTGTKPDDDGGDGSVGGDSKKGVLDPVVFDTQVMSLNPISDIPEVQSFPGYAEVHEHCPAYFYFTNPNAVPVKLNALHRDCPVCTSIQVAVLQPSKPTSTDPLAAVTGGATAQPTQPTGVRLPPLDGWVALDFDDKTKTVEVPPNAQGYVKVVITPNAVGDVQKSVRIGAQLDGQRAMLELQLVVRLMCVPAYNILPAQVDVGELPEGGSPKKAEFTFFSSTRPMTGDKMLNPPKAFVETLEPFISCPDKPEPLSDAERAVFEKTLSDDGKTAVRVTAAYRVKLTVRRDIPPGSNAAVKDLDIGPLERPVTVLADPRRAGDPEPGPKFTIKGNVTGIVALESGRNIDLGSFQVKTGTERNETLVSNRKELELEIVPTQCQPSYLKVKLGDPTTTADRRTWPLQVTIDPPNGGGALPASSVVVLRVKGTEQFIRIPVKGSGYR